MNVLLNERYDPTAMRLQGEQLLSEEGFSRARQLIVNWPEYRPTPLRELPGLARTVGVKEIYLKDEGQRFELGSFKVLGAGYAVASIAHAELARQGIEADFSGLVTGKYREWLGNMTVASATDGNHGRALAWAAKNIGGRCVVYLHSGVSGDRERVIESLGATTVRAGDTYDESSHACAETCAANGWVFVSDTAPEGGDAGVALMIMQGYRTLVEEALEQCHRWPTHAFVQAGCGGFAAAVVTHLFSRAGHRPAPRCVVVEPETASCVYLSAQAGRATAVAGALDTIMAGLAVGEVSAPAWELLSQGAFAFQTISDDSVCEAMRLLADGIDRDSSIVSGESGAAGVAGLLSIGADDGIREDLGLTDDSRVMLFSTENDTDPDIYRRIIKRISAPSKRGDGPVRAR